MLADGGVTSSLGIYPGFVLPEAQKDRKFHVLLGEGDVWVGPTELAPVHLLDCATGKLAVKA